MSFLGEKKILLRVLATTSDQFFTNPNEPQRLKIEALMYSFGLSHFQRATLGARRRPPPPHPPPPLTSIAADSGRYILQTVEVSGRFAKRHLGSSSRSRQLQRSPSPVDGLQSCSFFFFLLLFGRNVSRQTQTEFHGCWARGGSWLGCSFANVWMSIVFSK